MNVLYKLILALLIRNYGDAEIYIKDMIFREVNNIKYAMKTLTDKIPHKAIQERIEESNQRV